MEQCLAKAVCGSQSCHFLAKHALSDQQFSVTHYGDAEISHISAMNSFFEAHVQKLCDHPCRQSVAKEC